MTVADPSSAATAQDPSSLVVLVVDVPGTPVSQGSKVGYLRGRRVVLVDDNAKELKPWRAAIAAHARARAQVERWRTITGPCRVEATFWFLRPQIAAQRRYPSVRPDLDKLVRALLDGITDAGTVWRDDALVVDLTASKRYAVSQPGMRARIVDLTGQPTLDGEF